MNFLKNLFKPNDWYEVWATIGTWNVTVTYYPSLRQADETEKSSYTILYSPSRKKYKLEIKKKKKKSKMENFYYYYYYYYEVHSIPKSSSELDSGHLIKLI